MVTDDHHACLTDFGVAKMLSVSGYTTTSLGGTCRWMSPEILDEYDPSPTVASDIWAFGMTILQV
jgi:serine/threonine protein kinase